MVAEPVGFIAGWDVARLLSGEVADPEFGPDYRISVGAAAIPSDIGRYGPELLAQAWLEFFERNPDAEVVMRAARRAGIPWSQAAEIWSDPDDIAAEMGIDALDAKRADARCDSCGADPDSLVDPKTGKILAGSRAKLEMRHCAMCETRSRLESDMEADERKAGYSWTVTRRAPGDPFEDRAGHGMVSD